MKLPISALAIFLLSAQITLAQDSKDSNLDGSIDLGLTLLQGNSEATNGAANFIIKHIWDNQELELNSQYLSVRNYDINNNIAETTSRLYRSELQYNYFLSKDKEKYIWTNLGYRQDKPTGLIKRNTGGLGFGYQLLLFEDCDLNFEAGLSYVSKEKNITTQSAVGRASAELDWELSEALSIISSTELLNGNTIRTIIQDFGLRYDLNTDWFLKLSNNISYDGYPANNKLSTDSRWHITLGTNF